VKEEFKASGLRAMSYGFLGYPVSQAADILIVRSNLVPVGEDNVAHVEQTREIARTFNHIFGEVFPVPEPLVGKVPRLPGIDGTKMGKSTGNAIYLSDGEEEVRRKISMAITDPARVRASDKGHPDICNIYRYHGAYNHEESPDIARLCQHGKIGCVACKNKLAEKINTFLEPIRERRAYYEVRPSIVKEAVQEGNERTRREGRKTLNLVREAVHFGYRNLVGVN
jgi:tryptophanyl-tRNA synthetase